jgi:uncharacterized protein YyaL (SSP411 family)
MQTKRSANRLINETSPYLLQHAYNPVQWYPWGEEALQRAKREAKPIFLSIGYSACHWCHVMEHESFENEEIAKVMNDLFINIKVDREERPDLDHIYMSAVQVMTQHGGWPMSVFLTPDLEPFYGGTYFPPEDRQGMPGFKRILAGVAGAWTQRREEILGSAKQLTEALGQLNRTKNSQAELDAGLLSAAADRAMENWDPEYGGFGNAPKFFHTMDLRLLLRQWKKTGEERFLRPVLFTLNQITNGGIYDHIGGGFHRYSTDRRWLVPHFEKMLYDNALLTETFLEAFRATPQVEFARVARETLNYVLREMTSNEGGFFSTQDADSEGVEGKFYVWTKNEIECLLDKDQAELLCRMYDVTEEGNWEGHVILNRPRPLEAIAAELSVERDWLEDQLAASLRKLYDQRSQRVPPARDEKVLVSWNGLMIHAMALGYQVLGDDRYLEAATRAGDFTWDKCRAGQDKPIGLLHAYKDGQAKFTGYLDDYASLLNAYLSLYESTFDAKWITRAHDVAAAMIIRFWDQGVGDFYFTDKDHEKLITRPKEIHDGATPSATSMAITGLARLSTLMAKPEWTEVAHGALRALSEVLKQVPGASGQSLIALSFLNSPPRELVFAPGRSTEDNESALRAIRARFSPDTVIAGAQEPMPVELPALQGKTSVKGEPTLYVCRNFTCEAPLIGVDAITAEINQW